MHSVILKKIHPHLVLEKYQSKYNHEIAVVSQFGQIRLWAGGIPQTGGIVQSILKKHLPFYHHPKKILVLGLGGGGIVTEMHRRFPHAQITAIEIDPVMIEIAQKYFNVSTQPWLKIQNQDATEYVQKAATQHKKFDAILVDCYIGASIPPQIQSISVINNLSALLTPNGVVSFNRLNNKLSQDANNQLLEQLNKKFTTVIQQLNYSNLLIVAKP